MYYNSIDIIEGIDPNKSNRSKEYIICHSWFFNNSLKFRFCMQWLPWFNNANISVNKRQVLI